MSLVSLLFLYQKQAGGVCRDDRHRRLFLWRAFGLKLTCHRWHRQAIS